MAKFATKSPTKSPAFPRVSSAQEADSTFHAKVSTNNGKYFKEKPSAALISGRLEREKIPAAGSIGDHSDRCNRRPISFPPRI
jgi:hypothetical protein